MAHDGLRVENIVTSGIFALDGGEWEVDNNIWVVGNDDEVFIIDAHTLQHPSSRLSVDVL